MFFAIFYTLFLFFNPSIPLIEESKVIAIVSDDGYIYKEKELKNILSIIYKNDEIEILEDFSMQVYKIKYKEYTGWICKENIIIPKENPTDKTILKDIYIENFINENNFESKTDYLILTEINRQKTYILKKENKWKLEKTFDCATGKNISPTIRGIFEIKDRGDWFYSNRLDSGALYWLRFNNNYLLHSTPIDKNKNIIESENIVGIKISHGCVRFLLDDIKWIYDFIPDKTTIIII